MTLFCDVFFYRVSLLHTDQIMGWKYCIASMGISWEAEVLAMSRRFWLENDINIKFNLKYMVREIWFYPFGVVRTKELNMVATFKETQVSLSQMAII